MNCKNPNINNPKLKNMLQEAFKLHQGGNFAAAETFYNKILKKQPTHVDTIFLLGTLNLQQGNFDMATTFLKKAIALKPGHARAHNNLGTTLQEQGKIDKAIDCYKKAIKLNSDYAEAHYNIGVLLQNQGKDDEAITSYNRATEINPGYAEAYYNLGIVLQEQDKLDEAVFSYNKTIEIKPDYAEVYNNMGNVLKLQGKLDEAVCSYKKALELKPDLAEAYNNMGRTYADQGNQAEAISCLRKSLELKPDVPEVYNNMGDAFKELGKRNEALSSYQNSLRIKPDSGIEVKSSLMLPVINASKESINQHREKIFKQIESMKNRGITLEDPHKQIGTTNYYLAYHGLNDKEIQKEIASFYINACPDLVWTPPILNNQRQSHDKIKIGIISNYLCNHTMGKLNYGIIKYLSREKFNVKIFRFSGGREDHLSKAINEAADEVIILPKKLKPARQEIADHSLDILFYLDIGMDPLTYFLAFSRLAPVQCVTWGHPVTTGIPNMDYFISSDKSEPPGAEDHYLERLILPDRLTTYYYRPELPEVLTPRKDFDLPEDYNLYVCPQTLFKFHPDFDDVLGTLLRQDTRGLLVLIEGKHKHWTKLLQDRFSSAFPDVFDRVRFLPLMPAKDFLSLLKLADVILDTPYFGGGSTSLESFACGAPIVTWPGEFMRDRLTLALYKQMWFMECVADNAQSYLDIAYRLANDKTWREEIRDKIRANSDCLFEDIEAVHELERFFEMAVDNKKEGQLHQSVTNVNDLLQTGRTHHQAGNLEAASQLYQNILDQQPTHVKANFLLGTLNLQQGNLDTATTFLKKAISLKPDYAEAHNNLGAVLKEKHKLDEAINSFYHSIELNPDYAEAHYNLGTLLQKQNKLDEAVASYNRAIEINSNYADAYCNLGNVLQEQGKLNEAVLSYTKTIDLNPNSAEAYNNLGNVLQEQEKLDEAMANYNRALKVNPDFAKAYINMGNAFKELGKFNEALSSYRYALRLEPDSRIEIKTSLLLPIINESRESIKLHRKNIIEQISSMKARNLKIKDPHKQVGSTSFYLAYHGLDDTEIQKEIASFYIHACPDLVWTAPNHNQQQTDGKIKIGIISTFLFNHTIGNLNYGIIKYLSREKFHVKLFRFSGEKEDHLSKAINEAADEVVILPKKLKPARQEIAEHSLDILFYLDIGMDPLTYFLAFSRLAPVQCVTWGHPVTTGIPNMDYFISSDKSEPPGAEDHYSERLILPDRLTTYYHRPELPEGIPSREKFGLPENYNLYVCPQTLFKFHPDFDDVIGALLRQDTRGILVLIEGKHKHWTKLLHDRFSRTFPDVIDRVRFLPPMPAKDFLSLLMVSDVNLDTPYFGGGNTSLESFACNVPVVTWPGKFLRDRLTLALYKQMGFMECVADNAQSYLDIAYRLANDKTWRDEIKDKIRANSDVLYEDIEAVHELERFFEMAVENNGLNCLNGLNGSNRTCFLT
ncbi:MAG: tetratricopeptide repeat protein [Candidatus Scalindua sp.]